MLSILYISKIMANEIKAKISCLVRQAFNFGIGNFKRSLTAALPVKILALFLVFSNGKYENVGWKIMTIIGATSEVIYKNRI